MADMPILDGRVWRWPDGTTLPVVSGGSDDAGGGWPSLGDVHAGMGDGDSGDGGDGGGSTDPGGSTTTAESAPAAAPSAPSSTPAPGSSDPFSELPEGDSFTRSYVEGLRAEGAKHRTQLRQYEDVFSRYEQGDRDLWIDMARDWADGDHQGVAEKMRNIYEAVLGAGAGDGSPAGGQPVDRSGQAEEQPPQQQGLTIEDVQRFVEQRDADRARVDAENRAVTGIHDDIRAGGFEPDSDEGFLVMRYAARSVDQGGTAGDVPAAIAKVKARDQSVIDAYVAGKVNGGGTQTAPQQGVVATGAEKLQDFPKRGDVEAWLRENQGAQPGR